jgi:hypothetical protein
MAAVTSTLVALGGIGVSAAQAIKSQSQMKEATQASNLAKQQLKQIKETNPFKALQVPTLGLDLAQQQQSQREAQMVGALQGVGAEGVIGGIGNVAAAGNEQDMALAAQANQAQYGRDMAQAEAQLGIGSRQAERDWMAGIGEIQQQNLMRAQAQKNRNDAITGALGFAGSAAESLDDIIGLYKKQKSGVTTGTGGGVNWNYLYGNKANIPGLQQPENIITGSNINNPNAVLGNQGNQVIFP